MIFKFHSHNGLATGINGIHIGNHLFGIPCFAVAVIHQMVHIGLINFDIQRFYCFRQIFSRIVNRHKACIIRFIVHGKCRKHHIPSMDFAVRQQNALLLRNGISYFCAIIGFTERCIVGFGFP